jgi:hypothetical protein
MVADEEAASRAEVLPPDVSAPRGPRRHVKWAAYVWGTLVLASLAVAAPLALASIGRQLIAPPENQVFTFTPVTAVGAPGTSPADAAYMNLAVAGLDEAKKVATLRVSGHRTCTVACPAFTLRFFSLSDRAGERAGLPPSATLAMGEGAAVVSEKIELPVSGLPSLYPFDRYTLVLAAVATPTDAPPTGASPNLYAGKLTVTLESDLPRHLMLPPDFAHSPPAPVTDVPAVFQQVVTLHFVRPLHLQVLTCLLVTLIAAAALLSVSTEPLRRLLVGVGSVVLSVWGVRQILIADAPPAITAVDLLLSGVILILLYGLAIRVVLELRRGGWDSLHRLIRDG